MAPSVMRSTPAMIARISAGFPLQWSTASSPAPSARPRARRRAARQGLHAEIVRDQEPPIADLAADRARHHNRGQGRRRGPVIGGVDDMGGHRPGHVAQRPEGGEIDRQRVRRRIDHGKRRVAVQRGPPVPGDVLDDRDDISGEQPLADGAAERRDHRRIAGKGAVADHRMARRRRHVEHGQAVDVDAEFGELAGDAARVGPGCVDRAAEPLFRRHVAEAAPGRAAGPMRRREALHPAPLLVDQDRRVRAPYAVAQRRHQVADLPGLAAVAREQDEAQGVGIGEQGAFVASQLRPGAAEDDRRRVGPLSAGRQDRRPCAWRGPRRAAAPSRGRSPDPRGAGNRPPWAAPDRSSRSPA